MQQQNSGHGVRITTFAEVESEESSKPGVPNDAPLYQKLNIQEFMPEEDLGRMIGFTVGDELFKVPLEALKLYLKALEQEDAISHEVPRVIFNLSDLFGPGGPR